MKRLPLVGVQFLLAAAGAGAVHAGFTIYWACGGRRLLTTVGAWAVRLADHRPGAAGAVLGVVAMVKIAGCVIPVFVETGHLGGRRRWRILEWAGAAVLITYGLLNVVVAWAVLTGVITAAGGYDRSAELGHAALWDPLFLMWGLLLATGLGMTRDTESRGARHEAKDR